MQARAQRTRAQILRAATEKFSQCGPSGTTVDEIAAAAGVNKQRIYAYFGSKSGLFDAVLLAVFEDVELFSQENVDRAVRHPERLTEITVQGFLKVHAAHPDLWRLLAWANLEGPQCTHVLDNVRRKENEKLRQAYDRAVKDGILRPVPFGTWIFTLLAVTYFRYSNELTLTQTLGWDPALGTFCNSLAKELNNLFAARPGAAHTK